jgi:hypothetical protein
MAGRTAICFVLADPRPERPLERLDRRLRSLLLDVPLVRDIVQPRWAPARRLGFGAGLRACVQSLRRRHSTLPPILVLRPSTQPQVTLADVDEVVPIDPAVYASIRSVSSYYGAEVYYKLEVFGLRGYERIVYLDCDTIVLDDVSALWDPRRYRDNGLYAVRETQEMGGLRAAVGKLNTGVMVINPALVPGGAHDEMIRTACAADSYDWGDQGVVNAYIERTAVSVAGELEWCYNVPVVAKTRGRWECFENGIKILHFVNRFKPWAAYHHHDRAFDAEFKRLWNEAYGTGFPPAEIE